MDGGQWTDQKLEMIPFEYLRCRLREHESNEFGATIGCQGCNAIKDSKRAQAHSDRCRIRIEERLKTTPHGAERLDGRAEVINEALAEEVRREEQKRRRSDRSRIVSASSIRIKRKPDRTRSESEQKIGHEISVDVSCGSRQENHQEHRRQAPEEELQ